MRGTDDPAAAMMQEGPAGMKLSIRTKLILAIGIPLLAISLCVIWLDYVRSRDLAIEQTRVNLRSQARAQSARVEATLLGISRLAEQMADVVGATEGTTPHEYRSLLERTVLRHPNILWASLVFHQPVVEPLETMGIYVRREQLGEASLTYASYTDAARQPWVQRALQAGPGWGEPLLGQQGRFVSVYAVPIVRNGRTLGVAAVDVDIEWLREGWQQGKLPGEQIVVVSGEGLFLCHPDAACVFSETTESLAAMQGVDDWQSLGQAMTSGHEGVATLNLQAGRKWAVYTPIASAGWSYASLVSEDRVLQPVYDYLKMEMGILLVAMVLVELVVLGVSVKMTRPIERLARAVGDVGVGDLHTRIDGVETSDEIGEVARAFNKMVDHLQSHVEALSQQTAAREAVESELRIARSIQQSMLPTNGESLPDVPGISLHAVNHPAREVAGDFYDYFATEQGDKLGVLIADVSGKGVPAALFMAVAKTIIRNLARSGELSPAEVLTRANQLLLENNDDNTLMFVTLLFLYYDPSTGDVTYANAGHNRPFVLGPKGQLRQLMPVSGPVLGALERQDYTQFQEALAPCETLVLYTDGVTEAMSPEGVQYGESRLRKLLEQLADCRASEISERVVHEVDTFENHRHGDDITVLALQRRQ